MKRTILFIMINYNINRTYKCKSGKNVTKSLEYIYKTTAIEGFEDRVFNKLSSEKKLPILTEAPKILSREKKWLEIISVKTLERLGKTTYEL